VTATTRSLGARLQAWRSFRDIAHATRSVAAAQARRWNAAEVEARRHLTWLEALHGRVDPAAPPPGARVLLALGTDLGLCGRLNHLVADAVAAARRELRPQAAIVVGARLGDRALGPSAEDEAVLRDTTPSSFAALEDLAERIEVFVGARRAPMPDLVVVRGRLHPTEGFLEAVVEAGDPVDLPDLPAARRAVSGEAASLVPPERLRDVAGQLRFHARVVHAIATAAAVEADVRLQTMTQAHDAAERRIAEQELELRKAEQERITQEMLEVLAGRPKGDDALELEGGREAQADPGAPGGRSAPDP